VQGKITEAHTPTVKLGATPSGLISDPPASAPIFSPDALPAATLPLYPVLGQAPNMLDCIPSGCMSEMEWSRACVLHFDNFVIHKRNNCSL